MNTIAHNEHLDVDAGRPYCVIGCEEDFAAYYLDDAADVAELDAQIEAQGITGLRVYQDGRPLATNGSYGYRAYMAAQVAA